MSNDSISRCELFNILATIPAPPEANEFKAKIYAVIQGMETTDRPQEWIPCSERLPDEGEVVLVCMRVESHKAEWEEQRSIEFGRISSDRYDFNGTGWEWLNESGCGYWQCDWNNSILAWMPLPEPWGGADDEGVDSN